MSQDRGPLGRQTRPRLTLVPDYRERPAPDPGERPAPDYRERPAPDPGERPVPAYRERPAWGHRERALPGHREQAGAASRRRPAAGIRLTRRGRVVVTALLTALVLTVAALIWLAAAARAEAAGAGASPGSVYRNLTAVVVRPGQNLWSIAAATEPAADPRVVVQEIIDINALRGSTVQAGERLWVPRS